MKKQFVFLASLLAACAAQAGPIIYNNGAPDLRNGTLSDQVGNVAPGGHQVASNFGLGVDNVLADIHWWGFYNNTIPAADNFTIYIYPDSGGSPGSPGSPASYMFSVGAGSRTDTGSDVGGSSDLFEYKYDLSSITLTSGTTYWLSILNDTTSAPGADWYWATSNSSSGDDQFRDLNSGSPGPWGSTSDGEPVTREHAYNLTGPDSTSVPDAGSTLPLLGLALAGLAWCHRRYVRAA